MKLLLSCALLLGCSSQQPEVAEVDLPTFGDDRVADTLVGAVPVGVAAYEALFGVGRGCKDRFVLEERATRRDNVTLPMDRLVPRVVYGPCRDALVADLFTVLPTDPDRDPSDPLVRGSIEIMALDRTTKKYGFYVLDGQGVTRVFEDHGVVRTILTPKIGTPREIVDGDKRCFGCHVHGEPLMPTPSDPWTAWVSSRHPKPGAYAGETAAIVEKSGLANDLEPMVRNAVRAMVVAGEVDVRPAFCATTVQFASAPLSLFVDPGAVVGSGITVEKAAEPALVPVRADYDLRMESELLARKVLSAETVIALRLIDDREDAFSPARCTLLPAKFESDAQVRAILNAAFATRTDAAALYAKALLAGVGVDDARAKYFAEVRARIAHPDSTLATRIAARRIAARALFAGGAHPIPIAALP